MRDTVTQRLWCGGRTNALIVDMCEPHIQGVYRLYGGGQPEYPCTAAPDTQHPTPSTRHSGTRMSLHSGTRMSLHSGTRMSLHSGTSALSPQPQPPHAQHSTAILQTSFLHLQ